MKATIALAIIGALGQTSIGLAIKVSTGCVDGVVACIGIINEITPNPRELASIAAVHQVPIIGGAIKDAAVKGLSLVTISPTTGAAIA